MRLKKIEIANFKSLKSATFEPTNFSCLVGENNAGKSTVLQAIVAALNRPGQLASTQFHDPGETVEFKMYFSDVSEGHLKRLAAEHRSKIDSLVVSNELGMIVRFPPAGKLELKVLRRTPKNTKFRDDAIDEAFRGIRGEAVRTVLCERYPELAADAPAALTASSAKEFLRIKIARLPTGELEFLEAPLPSGIVSSIAKLLPEAIYIPAVKNLADDLKTSQSTNFGRLLGLLLEDMTPDLSQVARSLKALDKLLNRVVANGIEVDERHGKVRALETLVESFLGEHFPRAKVHLQIPPPELRAILNAAQIYIDDGSRDLIDNKGDGIKRSLTFAILRAYVEQIASKTAGDNTDSEAAQPRIFLFEEPELYLHPKSQRLLFDTLSLISNIHQVVVTTHSPLFFAPGVTAGFVRVAKREAQPKPIGVLHPVNFELDQEKAEVFRLARYENADVGFFSSRVVLFEGESDDAFMKHVAKHFDATWDFDKKNIGLIRVSGKGNFDKYRAFFSAFGIEVKIVADLDALFDGFHHLGADEKAVALRGTMLQKVDKRIQELGAVAPPSSRQIKDRVRQEGWRQKYEIAREAFRKAQTSGVTPETLEAINQLYAWEQEITRHRVCQSDDEAGRLLHPLLDALRSQGICVLSKGAIESYYPPGVPTSDSKPERALRAAALIKSESHAIALSTPLATNRPPELKEILAAIFDGT
jgi:predicted ATP-dependent endonuclease of OLD family